MSNKNSKFTSNRCRVVGIVHILGLEFSWGVFPGFRLSCSHTEEHQHTGPKTKGTSWILRPVRTDLWSGLHKGGWDDQRRCEVTLKSLENPTKRTGRGDDLLVDDTLIGTQETNIGFRVDSSKIPLVYRSFKKFELNLEKRRVTLIRNHVWHPFSPGRTRFEFELSTTHWGKWSLLMFISRSQ